MAIATKFWTYSELKAKVESDLDLEGEVFIQPAEMLGYFNEAIEAVEKIVHGLYEDYFLDHDPITLISGTNEYVLPTRIYAHKIRAIMYRNGSRTYEVMRIRDWKKFLEYTLNKVGGAQNSAEYRWFLINQAAGLPKALFTPDVSEDGPWIDVWFLRCANRFAGDTDILDVPEASNYVMQFVKKRCYEKEGHPNIVLALSDLAKEQADLEGILTAMIPDANNEVEMDLSFYAEMN